VKGYPSKTAGSRSAMHGSWSGRLFLGTGELAYAGPVGATAPHAHHAFQLLLSLDRPVSLRGAAADNAVDCQVAVIPPDVPHAFTEPSPSVLLLYVDPDGLVGRRLRRAVGSVRDATAWRLVGLPLLPVAPRAAPVTWADAQRLARACVEALAGPDERPQVIHPAVLRAVRYVGVSLDGDVRLGTVAVHAGISAGRLAHLFTQQVGLPLRPYAAWLRLQRAAAALRDGATLTEAAHHAGFTDGGHLTRIFRRMFGIRPSDIMGWAEWVLPEGHDVPPK